MDEVAAAAGLRKSSLYHYFSTKDDLLVSIHTAFMAFLHAQVEEPTRASLDPVAFLQAVVEDIVRSVDSYPHHVRVFFDHYRELPEPARLELSRSRDRYAAKIEEVIAEGMRAGYFRVGDSHLAMLAFFGVCNWTYAWYRPGGKLGPEEVADFLARFALGGLASNEPSRPQ
jgi:AcrR family transcriptional regulator